MNALGVATKPIRHQLIAVLFAFLLSGISGLAQVQELGPDEIVQRSIEVNRRDWDAVPSYDYFHLEKNGERTKTYEAIMLAGSRYDRLTAVDNQPLSPGDEAKEQHRFEATVAQRQQESTSERELRIQQYTKDRERDHVLIGELTKAFDFTLSGKEILGPYEVYVLKGTPRAHYRPPNKYAKALTGMRGTLWIDTATFHWVKAEAEVVRPVWIQGFAQIMPGTRFELEQQPVGEGPWMPSHFSMSAKAKVFFLFSHSERQDTTYFSYHQEDIGKANNLK